jgi:hypothetical protein
MNSYQNVGNPQLTGLWPRFSNYPYFSAAYNEAAFTVPETNLRQAMYFPPGFDSSKPVRQIQHLSVVFHSGLVHSLTLCRLFFLPPVQE